MTYDVSFMVKKNLWILKINSFLYIEKKNKQIKQDCYCFTYLCYDLFKFDLLFKTITGNLLWK
jgi:hypothetical protein